LKSSSINALSALQIESHMGSLPGWTFEADSLKKTYSFGSFREAMSFLVRIGFEAEELNHHPELFNVYSTVTVTLRTHDAGNKVTDKDIDLATRLERIAWI
jgi:4a-hydroxytetrahydrobiopterin dehydratase